MKEVLNGRVRVFLNTTLTVLLLFSMMAVPVFSGHTTSKLSVLLLVIMFLYLLAKGKFHINKSLIVVVVLYVLLIISLYQELLVDQKLLLQFLASTSFLLVLTIWWDRLDSRFVFLPLLIVIFLSGSLYFPIMIFGPITGVERLDVLYWQKDTGFFFGINKFLLAMFVINLVFLTAHKVSGYEKVLAFLFPVFYFSLAIFLGSRSHALLGFLSLILSLFYGLAGNKKSWKILVSLTFVVGVFLLNEITSAIKVNVLDRLTRDMYAFDSSPRGQIYNFFATCLEKTNFLYGNNVMSCVSSSIGDLDNTLMFVVSSGGLVSAVLFLLLVCLICAYVAFSDFDLIIKVYIIFSYIFLLNVDVIVMKSVFFLPMFICIINCRYKGCDKGVVSKLIVNADSKQGVVSK